MNNKKTCGECLWLHTTDGTPYYCLIQDLYTFRTKSSVACSEWEKINSKKNNYGRRNSNLRTRETEDRKF